MAFVYKTPTLNEVNSNLDVAMRFIQDRTPLESRIDGILADMLETVKDKHRLERWRYRELILAEVNAARERGELQ